MDDLVGLGFLLAPFAAGLACGYRRVRHRTVALGTLAAAAVLFVGTLLEVGQEPGETLLDAFLYGSVWGLGAVALLAGLVAGGYWCGEELRHRRHPEHVAPYDVGGTRAQREKAADLRAEVRPLLEPGEVVEGAVHGIIGDVEHTLRSGRPQARWKAVLRGVSVISEFEDTEDRPAAVVLTDRRLLFADKVMFVGQRSLAHSEILRIAVETTRITFTGPVTRLTVETVGERIVLRATDEPELRGFVAAARRRFVVETPEDLPAVDGL